MHLAWVAMLALIACSQPIEKQEINESGVDQTQVERGAWQDLDPPTSSASMAPSLGVARDELMATWLEVTEDDSAGTAHRLLFARLAGQRWSEPTVIAEGRNFFANWADTPAVTSAGDGSLIAHWLGKTDEETYAYSIFLARSVDSGRSWRDLGPLNDDSTPTEHGFVTYVPEGTGVRAFWLDGREMVHGGSMALRTAWVGAEVKGTEVLDERVCECCATAAALTSNGPVVVFRDRSADEVRDIGIVRRSGETWATTELVHADNWTIAGCPVNGPEVATDGDSVAVVWYSAGSERPKVQLALSSNGGASFGRPVVVDDGRPLGRVDVVTDGEGGQLISWLEAVDSDAEIRLRWVSAGGALAASTTVARTSQARTTGIPRLARIGEHLYLTWVETGGGSSMVRLRQIPLSTL